MMKYFLMDEYVSLGEARYVFMRPSLSTYLLFLFDDWFLSAVEYFRFVQVGTLVDRILKNSNF